MRPLERPERRPGTPMERYIQPQPLNWFVGSRRRIFADAATCTGGLLASTSPTSPVRVRGSRNPDHLRQRSQDQRTGRTKELAQGSRFVEHHDGQGALEQRTDFAIVITGIVDPPTKAARNRWNGLRRHRIDARMGQRDSHAIGETRAENKAGESTSPAHRRASAGTMRYSQGRGGLAEQMTPLRKPFDWKPSVRPSENAATWRPEKALRGRTRRGLKTPEEIGLLLNGRTTTSSAFSFKHMSLNRRPPLRPWVSHGPTSWLT